MRSRAAGLLLIALAVGCQRLPVAAPVSDQPFDRPGLHNVLRVADGFYSGSGPEGEAGFRSLRELGVRTVISVDGARPAVELARRHGLRYVHLPVGYDGVPRGQALRIARAVRDLPGPVYLHCHHGKHRGPAAAAAAARCLDGACTAERALKLLQTAGTDPRYTGLYASVERIAAPTVGELDGVPADFPEVAAVSDLARLMVAIDEHWDHLKAIKAAGWKPPPGHADLDPPHEALQLREHYRESVRLPALAGRPAELRQWLADAEAAAGDLETALRAGRTADADAAFRRSATACTACHARYRDVPNGS